jgi:outer membrane PBP1 activator LpoA protein
MEKINERAGNKTDAVFLAADPAAARFIRPYLPGGMPVFATSHTVDPRAEAVANLDLENVRFLEMPWFAEPDHPAVMAYAKPQQSLAVEYERLYALGIDAWRLGQLIARTDSASAPLDGVTGRITLDGRQFTRALSSVEVRDGKTLLYRPVQ